MNLNRSAVIIPAAGFSARMGTHKALLPFSETETFIEHIAGVYLEAGIDQIFVVANNENEPMLKKLLPWVVIVLNEHPEYERFYSLKLAAEKMKVLTGCFVHNCDQPFVDKDLLTGMMQMNAGSYQYVVPARNNKTGHPVLLGKEIIRNISVCRQINISLREFLADYEMIRFEAENDDIFININTMADLIKIKAKAC